ncbi:MAG TPA: TetR/AcrR family transcriptional regulator [Iamia sp.]|nr:TetR/AcrR family transcriptional regulator [Iamia sp.]
MADTAARLPRGRHTLTRDQVAADQRARMMLALAEVMGEKGFGPTSVADVIGRAGVSRQTFYEQFSSKLDCFLATFDTAGELLLAELDRLAGADGGSPIDRFDRLLAEYLDTMARWSGYARVLLVESHAAGAEAIGRRVALQERIVAALAGVLEVDDERGRFALAVLVAAIGSMVTEPLVRGDGDALRALHAPIVDLVAAALAARER